MTTGAVGARNDPDGAPSRPPAGPTGDITVTTLPSGRRVVTDRMPGSVSATVVAVVGVGGRDEPPALAGASHFLEHLLCKGSVTRPAATVAEEVDARGGELDAVTDRERTAVQIRVPAGDAPFALDLLGELVLRPALRPREVDLERRVILEELAQAEEDPEDRAHSLTATALFGDHPLAREVLGDRGTLGSMGPAQIRAFHADRYRPGAMVVAAAGAVDHDAVVAAVARWDDDPIGPVVVPPADRPATTRDGSTVPTLAGPGRSSRDPGAKGLSVPRTAPQPVPPATHVLRRPGEQVHLVLGWPLGPVAPEERVALTVVAHLLGGGPASRLFRAVRDERGLAYAIDAALSTYSDAGTLTAYAACSPASTGAVRQVMADEVAALAAGQITEHQVEVAAGYLAGSLTLALDDSATRAWRVGVEELERGGARPPAERVAAYRAVTVEDVGRAAQALAREPVVVAVGPVPRRMAL